MFPICTCGLEAGIRGGSEEYDNADRRVVEDIYIVYFLYILFSHIFEMSNITYLRFIFRDTSSDTEILNSIRNHVCFFADPKGAIMEIRTPCPYFCLLPYHFGLSLIFKRFYILYVYTNLFMFL